MIGLVFAVIILVLALLKNRAFGWKIAFHSVYGIFIVFAILAIPYRTGFQLVSPTCEIVPSIEGAVQALGKLPHIILFGLFFILAAIQFPRSWRSRFLWAMLATIAFGLIIEFEEGATLTGNCRMRDLLPDILGGLIGATLIFFVEWVIAKYYPIAEQSGTVKPS